MKFRYKFFDIMNMFHYEFVVSLTFDQLNSPRIEKVVHNVEVIVMKFQVQLLIVSRKK